MTIADMTTTPNTTASGAADRYTKKPVTIDAIRWTGKNLREVIAFTDGPPDTRTSHAGMAWDTYVDLVERDGLKIFTLEGKMSAAIGDWIIKGVQGEMYPCKPDIFEATYSAALAASAPVAPTPQPVPEALRLAKMLTADEWPGGVTIVSYARECVAELRRLHAENERLAAAPKAAPPAPLQHGDYPPLPEPDTHCYDEDKQVDVWSYSAEQMHAYLDADRAARGAAQPAPAEDDKWRSLALQFDSHRMQALSHLKLLLECGEDHADAVRTFLAGPPLDGESVLAQRIAAYAQPAPASGETETCKCCGEGSARIVVRRECDTCTSVYAGVAEHRIQKSLAAPPAQEARVPLSAEQQRCIAEAHNVAACEEYFNARPQIDYIANRRIFEAGFSKGYGITAAQKETP